MNKITIINQLKQKHQDFITYIMSLDENDFLFQYEQKWTAGQQFDHIVRSVKPLLALRYPKFLLKLVLGKSNRTSMSYEELAQKYKDKIATGAGATGPFIPPPISFNQKKLTADNLNKTLNALYKTLEKYSEEDFDVFIAPHPLLGKLTLRELLYFTIFHVEHHTMSIKEMLTRK